MRYASSSFGRVIINRVHVVLAVAVLAASLAVVPAASATDPVPAVTALSTHYGLTGGGATVVVTGRNFVAGSTVTFGEIKSPRVRRVSSTELKVVEPPHDAGYVHVRVHTAAGISAKSPANGFSFGVLPAVAAVSPVNGVHAGGAPVTVTGSGFGPSSTVRFGGAAGTAVTVDGTRYLTVTAPAHATGRIDVRVTTKFGTSVARDADSFTYLADPRPLAWTDESVFDPPLGGTMSVSCPTTTFCAMVDQTSHVLTFDGTSWSSPEPIAGYSGYQFWHVSCPAPGQCVAVAEQDAAAVLTDGVWQDAPTMGYPGGIDDLSCTSVTFCMALTNNGTRVFRFDGNQWSELDPISVSDHFSAVSCVTPSFCAAVSGLGYGAFWDGSAWSTPVQLASLSTGIFAVSCTSTAFCVAAFGNGPSVAVVWNGTSWGAPIAAPSGVGPVTGLSCVATNRCVVMRWHGYSEIFTGSAFVDRTRTGVPYTWTLSCVTTRMCVAAGPSTPTLAYDGTTWSVSNPDPPLGQLSQISCASDSFCAALDANGAVFVGDGATWSGPTWLGSFDANTHWQDLSCSSPTFCAAIGLQRAATYDGHNWTVITVPGLGADSTSRISCSSSTNCIVINNANSWAHFDGTSWSSTVPLPSGYYAYDLSCTGPSFCAAVGYGGALLRFDGDHWTPWARSPLRSAGDVDCLTSSFCLASDGYGRLTTFDGTSWSPGQDAAPGFGSDLSCASTTLCLVAGISPAMTATTLFDGTAWSARTDTPGPGPRSISCLPSGRCIGITGTGSRIASLVSKPTR